MIADEVRKAKSYSASVPDTTHVTQQDTCAICDDPVSTTSNQIIYCDGKGISITSK